MNRNLILLVGIALFGITTVASSETAKIPNTRFESHDRDVNRDGLHPDDDEPMGLRRPLILVHGLNGDGTKWNGFLAEAGSLLEVYFKVYRFQYDTTDGVPINGNKLATAITETRAAELGSGPVYLVAHSMGGLVSRWCIEEHPEVALKLGRLITLGTPHHGTPLANRDWVEARCNDAIQWISDWYLKWVHDISPDSPGINGLKWDKSR